MVSNTCSRIYISLAGTRSKEPKSHRYSPYARYVVGYMLAREELDVWILRKKDDLRVEIPKYGKASIPAALVLNR